MSTFSADIRTGCKLSTARTFDRKALCSPLRGAARRWADIRSPDKSGSLIIPTLSGPNSGIPTCRDFVLPAQRYASLLCVSRSQNSGKFISCLIFVERLIYYGKKVQVCSIILSGMLAKLSKTITSTKLALNVRPRFSLIRLCFLSLMLSIV